VLTSDVDRKLSSSVMMSVTESPAASRSYSANRSRKQDVFVRRKRDELDGRKQSLDEVSGRIRRPPIRIQSRGLFVQFASCGVGVAAGHRDGSSVLVGVVHGLTEFEDRRQTALVPPEKDDVGPVRSLGRREGIHRSLNQEFTRSGVVFVVSVRAQRRRV